MPNAFAQQYETGNAQIPIIDIGAYMSGDPEAVQPTADAIREASEALGFYYLQNHGVARSLIDRVFVEIERFHSLPIERKMAVRATNDSVGYLPLGGQTQYTSKYAKIVHPDRMAAYYVREQYPDDHPDRIAGKPWVWKNQWPEGLPGFRETMLEYFAAMTDLNFAIMELQAISLGLPADTISNSEAFRSGTPNSLKALQYPPADPELEGQFGIAPHTDYGYGAIMAQENVPGLEILTQDGRWIKAPALPEHLLYNNGDLCQLMTNDRFRSAPHQVINNSGTTRYSIPFLTAPRMDVNVEVLSTCQGPDNPPRYEPISFGEYFGKIKKSNYKLEE